MKFSVRDLLLVTVIVALAVGWWVDRSRLYRELDRERIRDEQSIRQWQHDVEHELGIQIKERFKKEPGYVEP